MYQYTFQQMKSYFSILFLLPFLFLNVECKKETTIEPSFKQLDTTSHNFAWTADTIGIYPSYLHGIWGSDVNNVYAVGLIVLSNPPAYAYTGIMHWDGTLWTSQDYQEGDLRGIFGFGPNDIWAVGSWSIDYNPYSLITHWDGKTWTTWKPQQYNLLSALWGTSSSNLYAVGLSGLILHYDGKAWTQQQSGTTMDLADIWGTDNSHIWAAGYQTSTGDGVLLQYDGVSWKTITRGGNTSDTSLYGNFYGVWCNSTDKIILVGSLCYEGTLGQLEALRYS